MVINNKDFGEYLSGITDSFAQYNGQPGVHFYNQEEKERMSNPRPETKIQSEIYQPTTAKLTFGSIEDNFSKMLNNGEDSRTVNRQEE